MCFGVLTGRVSGLKVEDGLDCLYSSLCSCSRLFLQLRLVSNECTARHPRLFNLYTILGICSFIHLRLQFYSQLLSSLSLP